MLSGWTLVPAQSAMPVGCPQMAQQEMETMGMDAMPCCASHRHGAPRHDAGCQVLCAVGNGMSSQPAATLALDLQHVLPTGAMGVAYMAPLRIAAAIVPSASPPFGSPPPSTRLLL